MKIIGLSATKNRGKTTTLNKLIDLLALVADNYEINRDFETKAYFEINGKGITVCTPGDDRNYIRENIEFLMKSGHKTDLFVTPSHVRDETVKELAKFTRKECATLVWITKENNEAKNTIIAARLFGLIIREIYPEFDSSVYPAEENQ